MTWEELAKFIMEMPDKEKKRPAFVIQDSSFPMEVETEGTAFKKDVSTFREFRRSAKDRDFWLDGLYTWDSGIKEGDWVIE